jgi:hypothetical protein
MSPVDPPTQPLPIDQPLPLAAKPAADSRRRRRRTAVTLGLAALPVVGSAFVLPAIANAQPAAPVPTAAAVVLPAADRPTTGPDENDSFVQAYIDAGYSADDAAALAQQWGTGQDFYQVKVKAGRFLKQGIPLKASPLADPTAVHGYSDGQLVDLFVGCGYTLKDAQLLADKWGVDVSEAKARAGRELKTVGVLPFVDPAPVASSADDAAFTAFFDAGFDYDDAVALAKFWGLGQPADAKVKAGNLVRAGQPLPAVPGVSG